MRKEKSVSVQSGLVPSVLGVNIENNAETCQHYKIDAWMQPTHLFSLAF